MHRILVLTHRWVGLATAAFLFIAGVTGAIMAWEHEVDCWLNPRIFRAESARSPGAKTKTVLELAEIVERDDPRLKTTYFPLAYGAGKTAILYVEGRPDPATGKPFDLGFNQVFVDPATGKVQGQREWGEISARRECWIPFLYRLHYSLHMPEMWGNWLMGVVAIAWTIDCFVALAISFPNPRSWRRSFVFRLRQGPLKLLFDVHRSGGVWTWVFLLILAVTSVSMNLGHELVEPLINLVATRRQSPFDVPSRQTAPVEPVIGRGAAIALAESEARRQQIDDPPGAIGYSPEYGYYNVGFFDSREDQAGHGGFGWSPAWFYVDGRTGEVVGHNIPGRGSWGDRFVDLQFPLHSGRLLGTPGRALVSFLGVVVAVLSATGVILWARKKLKRVRAGQAQAWHKGSPLTG